MSNLFENVKEGVLPHALSLCLELFPLGKHKGNRYLVGSIDGSPGESLDINLDKGLWCDYAENQKPQDIIALYAAAKGIGQYEAAKELADRFSIEYSEDAPVVKTRKSIPPQFPAPEDATPPKAKHDGRWCYHDASGRPIFWVYRHDESNGKKRFSQWTWDPTVNAWKARGWKGKKPLYHLKELTRAPKKTVLLVEGEKCVQMADKIMGDKVIATTWPGGANGITSVDWSVLRGRKVAIWPDRDAGKGNADVGFKAAMQIAQELRKLTCDVNIVDVSDAPIGDRTSWDICDAVADGMEVGAIRRWVNDRLRPYEALLTNDLIENGLVVHSPGDGTIRVSDEYSQAWESLGLFVNQAGKPIANEANVRRCIQGMVAASGERLWFDGFKQRFMVDIDGDCRPYDERDEDRVVKFVQETAGIANASRQLCKQGVASFARSNWHEPLMDHVESLKWDGTPRITDLLIRIAGAEDSEYTRGVTRNMYIGLMARLYEPGSKVDNMVILEGKQGARKSTFVESIVPPGYFTDIVVTDMGQKDYVMSMVGYWVVEVGELAAFKRADVDKLKSMITDKEDNYRIPYAVQPTPVPRRSIFIGTTNNDTDYLSDQTGARRFWPVKLHGIIDIDYVNEYRDQMLAEARDAYKSGEPWHIEPAGAEEQQELRRFRDPWEDELEPFLRGRTHAPTMTEMFDHIGIDMRHITPRDRHRMAGCLKALGYTNRRERRPDGSRIYVWAKDGEDHVTKTLF